MRSRPAGPGVPRSRPMSSRRSSPLGSTRLARYLAPRSTTWATRARTAARAARYSAAMAASSRDGGPATRRCPAIAAPCTRRWCRPCTRRGARPSAGWSRSAQRWAATAWSECGSTIRRFQIAGALEFNAIGTAVRAPGGAAAAAAVHLRSVRAGLREAHRRRRRAGQPRTRHLDRLQARRLADQEPDPVVGRQ